jgi:hypothetical protein
LSLLNMASVNTNRPCLWETTPFFPPGMVTGATDGVVAQRVWGPFRPRHDRVRMRDFGFSRSWRYSGGWSRFPPGCHPTATDGLRHARRHSP